MYPFYAKDTFGLNYYKVNSATEGLKVGPESIVISPDEIQKLVEWKKRERPHYFDLVAVTDTQFFEHFTIVQQEINRNLIFK
jgi:hypothetical protein